MDTKEATAWIEQSVVAVCPHCEIAQDLDLVPADFEDAENQYDMSCDNCGETFLVKSLSEQPEPLED